MQQSRIIAGMATAALVASAVVAGAQTDTAIDREAIDRDAIRALERMGGYLRSLNAFQVQAAITTEDVLLDGEKVQSSSSATLLAARPNRLRAEVVNDRQPRTFFYDGKAFTLWAPRLKFYASVDAPPTAAELASRLEDRYGIDLPFVDLFRWGTPEANIAAITSASDVGAAVVDGMTCEQYAFRQDGLDWQIWIQQGEYPLPRKLVLTTTSDEARPQHASLYTWNLAPSFNDKAFAFTPPDDAKRITIVESAGASVARKTGSGGGNNNDRP